MPKLLGQHIPTLLAGLGVFATLLAVLVAVGPTSTTPLERGWDLTGVYGRTGAGRASAASTVGETIVFCDVNAFFSGGECGSQWSGQMARVRQVRLPTLVFHGLQVSDIWIGGNLVFHLTDDELRQRWWSGSLYWLCFGTFIAMFVTAAIHQYCFIDKRAKR